MYACKYQSYKYVIIYFFVTVHNCHRSLCVNEFMCERVGERECENDEMSLRMITWTELFFILIT